MRFTLQLNPKTNSPTYEVLDQSGNSIELINRFLHALELRGLSRHTVRSYGFDLVVLYRWLETTSKTLEELKQADLLSYIAHQKEKNDKPRSINRRLSTCEIFYEFCYDKHIPGGAGAIYPAPHYRGPGRDRRLGLFRLPKPSRLRLRVKVPRTLVEPLEVKEVKAFLKDVSRYRDLGIILLMLCCGLRSSEVVSIQLEDIQLEQRRLKVRGKGNRERMLPLPEFLINIFNKYSIFERPSHSRTPNYFTVLQGKRRGYPMSLAGLRSLFRYRRLASLVSRANPHLWRHSFACDLARVGVQLPVIQKLMGHSDPHITLQYIHLSMRDIAEEYNRAMARISKNYEHPCIPHS